MLTDNSYGLSRPRPLSPLQEAESAYLDSVLASTVFDLDATIADSYPGSGTTWANLVAAPADGSAQTAYDFYTGDGSTGTTYPTFNGTPGDAAAYWSFDGGDWFDLKSGANTAFLNNLHKTTGGADFWVAFTFRLVDSAASGGFFSTQSGSSNIGCRVELGGTNERVFLLQRGNTASVNSTLIDHTAGVDYIFIYSYQHSTNTLTRWQNTATGTDQTVTFNATTTDASAIARIAAARPGSYLRSGDRLNSFAMGNEYLDDTGAAAIIAHLNARHGRTYA